MWFFMCCVVRQVPLGFMNGCLAKLGKLFLIFLMSIFLRRTFLSVRIVTTKLLELNFNKQLCPQEPRNNNLPLLYILFFRNKLVEKYDPFNGCNSLKRNGFQRTEQYEAALVSVTVLLNLHKVFHF